MTRIFGYAWEAIQAAQQGGMLVADRPITVESWSARDQELLDQHGSAQALTEAGWHGVADRVQRGLHLAGRS